MKLNKELLEKHCVITDFIETKTGNYNIYIEKGKSKCCLIVGKYKDNIWNIDCSNISFPIFNSNLEAQINLGLEFKEDLIESKLISYIQLLEPLKRFSVKERSFDKIPEIICSADTLEELSKNLITLRQSWNIADVDLISETTDVTQYAIERLTFNSYKPKKYLSV